VGEQQLIHSTHSSCITSMLCLEYMVHISLNGLRIHFSLTKYFFSKVGRTPETCGPDGSGCSCGTPSAGESIAGLLELLPSWVNQLLHPYG
jgi:hypothetical protein